MKHINKSNVRRLRQKADKLEKIYREIKDLVHPMGTMNFMVAPTPRNLRELADKIERQLEAQK